MKAYFPTAWVVGLMLTLTSIHTDRLLCPSQAFTAAATTTTRAKHVIAEQMEIATTKKSRVTGGRSRSLAIPRGGSGDGSSLKMMSASTAVSFLEQTIIPAITSGPYGVLALTAISASIVVPLTLYKQLYAISVGYGGAIFAIGLALQLAFQPVSLLGRTCNYILMFYGARLASYLLLRQFTRKVPLENRSKKPSSIPQRMSLALSVSLFYAFQATPALMLLRNISNVSIPNSWQFIVTQSGIGLAVVGALLEAVADWQKYLIKMSSPSNTTKGNSFTGPTGWTYRICRHPNYLGEVLFWTGIFVGGIPSLGKNVVAWLSSVLGYVGTCIVYFPAGPLELSFLLTYRIFTLDALYNLSGIVSIMNSATSRIETRHVKTYGGQLNYESWAAKVKSPLIPFCG